ncbi:MAG: DUF4236 domain-containing protein [Nitrospirae bacterium]|nr:DUF4236 domain-containing protein [Nitrospirota bacterium]
MGLNFRKSINLGGGLRLNLSKKGVGSSFRVKGLRFGIGPMGVHTQASFPGTGLFSRKQTGWKSLGLDSQTDPEKETTTPEEEAFRKYVLRPVSRSDIVWGIVGIILFGLMLKLFGLA